MMQNKSPKVSVQVVTVMPDNIRAVSLLEKDLDFEHVSISSTELAIRAIHPLEIIVNIVAIGTGTHILVEFFLKPLTDPLVVQWKKFIAERIRAIIPFKLLIKIGNTDLIEYTVPSGTNHELTKHVFDNVRKALEIVAKEIHQPPIHKIKFIGNTENKLTITCYQENRPTRLLDLDSEKTTEISHG